MRFLSLLLFLPAVVFGQYDYQNISLMSRFDDPAVTAEPVYGIRYQSCWGWSDPSNGREYAIIGSTAGTYIIEVTDPANPVQRDYVPGRSGNRIWHEYKTYQNYLYIIADGGNNSLQIADLSTLPDSVHLIYDGIGIFDSGHTLYVDGDKLYVASVSRPGYSSSMNVYSLSNPAQPALLRQLDQDFPAISQVHDMYVINDTVFASCGYQGLYIFRYDSIANQFYQLSSLVNYPDQGYNHSSFLDISHTVLYMCDEVPDGMAVKVVDVSDIFNPVVVDTFYSNQGATPHNPYVIDDHLYMAYYQDGVYAYDISTPSNPVPEGFFDTHPQNPAGTYPFPAYAGCWAVYTDLPSGRLLASDMQRGLFVLDVSQLTNVSGPFAQDPMFYYYPHPAASHVTIRIPAAPTETIFYIEDMCGKAIKECRIPSGATVQTIDISDLSSGAYLIRSTGKLSGAKKLIVTR